MKLYRLSFLHHLSNRNRPARLIGPQEVSNEKIAALESILVLINHDAEMEGSMGPAPVFLLQRFEHCL